MKILVLSERDDCCGPMAAAFLRDYSEKLEVVSAGRHPADKLPGLVVEAMRECLIDMEGYEPAAISSMNVPTSLVQRIFRLVATCAILLRTSLSCFFAVFRLLPLDFCIPTKKSRSTERLL